MKKIILPALLAATALLLYNCTDTDADPLDNNTETFDSLQPGNGNYDTITGDTVGDYPGDYPVSDTVPGSTEPYPGDTIVGDSTVVVEPYPGEPDYPTFPGDDDIPADTITGDSI